MLSQPVPLRIISAELESVMFCHCWSVRSSGGVRLLRRVRWFRIQLPVCQSFVGRFCFFCCLCWY